MVASSGHGNESSISIKGGEVTEQLSITISQEGLFSMWIKVKSKVKVVPVLFLN
jgi:hypothetical protein